MIKRLGHAAFTVENMEKSMNFYCNVLGCKHVFDLNDKEGNPYIVYLKVVSGQFIELFYGGNKNVTIDRNTIGFSHICLEVDDIHQIADQIKGHGISLDVEPKLGIDGNWQCWVKDPDGNRLEFMQLMPGTPHTEKGFD
jgi:catechol 2,3-dioxygenase-like lactoylglutathione lyase family enzyme